MRRGEWLTASALAFSHGANDAQKTMGVVALLLFATGHLSSFSVPVWVRLMAAGSLTIGTAFGGWRIVRTVGSGIYRMTPLDGLVSQGGSAAVILAGAALGAPVSTTHVVASSVVGVGMQQRTPPCELVRGARDRGCVVDHAADQCRGGGCGVPTLE